MNNNVIKQFFLAIKNTTVIPLKLEYEVSEIDTAESVKFYPAVGFIIGIFLIFIQVVFSFYFPTSITKAIVIASLLTITGWRYLEDFLSVTGKWLSRYSTSNANILGACVIFALIFLKYIALGEYLSYRLYAILLLFPVIGRVGMLTLFWMFPGIMAKQKPYKSVKYKDFMIVVILSFVLGIIFLGLRAVLIFGCVFLFVIFSGKYFSKKSLTTHEFLPGFVNESCELIALVLGTMVI